MSELNTEELKAGSVEAQRKKDAIYQLLSVQLCDESNVEIKQYVTFIQEDLEREASYLIVKSRAIQLLSEISNFQALQSDPLAQEALLNGVINIYVSQE
jgi:hypothetical protein